MFISFLKNICINIPKKSVLLSRCRPQIFCVAHIKTDAIENKQDGKSQINITQSCVERLKKIACDGVFLRVSVDGGGCAGFEYRFDLDSVLKDDDVCFNRAGAKIVVDKISLDFLKGATIDYKEELIRSSFAVTNNPQAESKCSCGTSFAIKIS